MLEIFEIWMWRTKGNGNGTAVEFLAVLLLLSWSGGRSCRVLAPPAVKGRSWGNYYAGSRARTNERARIATPSLALASPILKDKSGFLDRS